MSRLSFLEVFRDKTGGNTKLQTSAYQNHGRFPIIDQGRDAVAGYTDREDAVASVDLPVIIFGDHTRAIKYVDQPFVLGADGAKVLCPRQDGDARFLFHYLRSVELPSAGYSRHFKYLKEITVPFPAHDEQRRIATILDKADELRAKRRQAIAHLDTLTQSIFHSMFGALDRNNVLSDAVSDLVGGRNLVGADDSTNSYRVLRISAVTSGRYIESESKPLPVDYVPMQSHLVRTGDVIISRANTAELVGASALVDATNGTTMLPDKLWRAVPAPGVVPRFLLAALQTQETRDQMSRVATGSGGSMKNISKPKLLSIPFILPPLELQQAFASRIAAVERLKETHRKHLAELDALFASLQNRAFKGEL